MSLFGPGEAERVGTLSFVLDGWDSGRLAAVLSAEYGIGVRDGLFCAHLLATRLLRRAGVDPEVTGSAVRASLGLATTAEHVDRLVRALDEVSTRGPRWHYAVVDGRWQPHPDPRAYPTLLR
ncbi:MAG: aminotransferase class V-fold PLP-dependent enzyme, partial [Streptosporangiales bacterium]